MMAAREKKMALTAQHTVPIPDATLYLICLNDKFEGVCE